MRLLYTVIILSIFVTPIFALSTYEQTLKYSGKYEKISGDGKLLCNARLSCTESQNAVNCSLNVTNYESGKNNFVYVDVNRVDETTLQLFKSKSYPNGGHAQTIHQTFTGEITFNNGKYDVRASTIELTSCKPDEFIVDVSCNGMTKTE